MTNGSSHDRLTSSRRLARAIIMLACVLTFMTAAGSEVNDSSQSPKAARIRVFPSSIELSTARGHQSIVVQAEYPDGSTRDVTANATGVAGSAWASRGLRPKR
jgi:hypothetical protein